MKWMNKRTRTTKQKFPNSSDYSHNNSSLANIELERPRLQRNHSSPCIGDTSRSQCFFMDCSASVEAVLSNEDLLTEILLHVPVRSLMYLKSVSKKWLSLITGPHFTLLRNPLPCRASALILHYPDSLCPDQHKFLSLDHNTQSFINGPFNNLNFVQDTSGIVILQSCNGLLLCCSNCQYRRPSLEPQYYIYNPTTKHFTILPQFSGKKREVHGMSLAFDPSKSTHYKVVCVRKYLDLYQIEVYSSETGPWRVWGQPFAADNGINFGHGVYCYGSIHWICEWTAYDSADTEMIDIWRSLYFNVYEERLGTAPMPPIRGYSDDRRDLYFAESEGHLHVTELHCNSALFSVYEMKSDCSGWFLKYKVDLTPLSFAFPEIVMRSDEEDGANAFVILSLVSRKGQNEVDDSFLVLEIPGKIIRYNLVAKTTTTLWESSKADIIFDYVEQWFSTCPQAYQYIESLSFV